MSASQQRGSASATVEPPSKQPDKLYHTVTACVRCRQRKTRCDPGLPRCEPCERSNARCEYFDPSKNRLIPRTYITSLQRTLAQLQQDLQNLEKEQHPAPDAEVLIRGGASIKFSEYDESRYLGPSSGIAITRLVMELAKQHTSSKSIREVVPQVMALDIKKTFSDESGKPTSKVYPLISSVPANDLPSRDLIERLVDLYMVKGQYMLPVLHEPTFRNEVEEVFNGSTDPSKNFQLRMVIANSMQMLDTQYAGLADSYYLAALLYLEKSLERMDVSTLQCFALMAQYSTLTPTRTASYWIVGFAARLCQDLGLCDEETIEYSPTGARYNTLEIDMRRRLYWVTLSMEYGLSHSLGRPSCFGISVDHINTNFFETCDDRFITPDGILPGAQSIMKKCISIHFFRMRLLQAEIRRMLYLKKRSYPTSDKDQWFRDMESKLDNWVASCPRQDEGSGFSPLWFQVRLNTMIILLYRPSPQIPEPSLDAAKRCYDAAVTNISFMYQQLKTKAVPVTWIFTLTICMELNTTLWTLSYPAIRQQHPFTEVKPHVDMAMEGLGLCSDRWPGVLSALQLYRSLIAGCLQAYRSDTSYVIASPSNKTSPTSTQDVVTPSAQSPASHTSQHETSVLPTPPHPQNPHHEPPRSTATSSATIQTASSLHGGMTPQSLSSPSSLYRQTQPEPGQSLYLETTSQPSYGNALPAQMSLPQWSVVVPMDTSALPWPDTSGGLDEKTWLGSIGEEYSRYMHQSFFAAPSDQSTLSQQQQRELMASLETGNQVPDVSQYVVDDARTIYNGSNIRNG